MAINPPAIIFVNHDLTTNVQDKLVRQLFISEVIDGYVFDDRVTADPTYVSTVHLTNLRLMVVRPFTELTNRDLADLVIFVKAGLASIEMNKFGPPGLTLPVLNLYWGALGVF